MTSSPDSAAALGDLTSEQVARLDAAAAACGVSTLQLMEVAGWQVARCAWHHLGGAAAVGVVAGYGNNGGDGLVAARHLATWGCAVRVLVLGDEARVTGVVRDHVVSARKCGVDVVVSSGSRCGGARRLRRPHWSSTRSSAPGCAARLANRRRGAIRALNESPAAVLSVDVPSGLDATTGEAFDPTVRAALTCTLTAMKQGLRRGDAATHAGAVWVADIGMPATAWLRAGLRQTIPASPEGSWCTLRPDLLA